jgi:hypothetical protein
VRRAAGRVLLVLVLALVGCSGTLSPLRHRMKVGQDPYLVFVADGPDGRAELYAARPNGSDLVQVTFTPVAELAPALSPDGAMVAFLRAASADSGARRLWVMNLLNGAERELRLPRGTAPVDRIAWSDDGSTVYARAGTALLRAPAPPAAAVAQPVGAGERPAVEARLAVRIGEPAFARLDRCVEGDALCAAPDSGAPQRLVERGRDPVRWGADSVGYFVEGQLLVRPIGPGRPRQVELTPAPLHPRQATYFPGAGRSRPTPPLPPAPAADGRVPTPSR